MASRTLRALLRNLCVSLAASISLGRTALRNGLHSQIPVRIAETSSLRSLWHLPALNTFEKCIANTRDKGAQAPMVILLGLCPCRKSMPMLILRQCCYLLLTISFLFAELAT